MGEKFFCHNLIKKMNTNHDLNVFLSSASIRLDSVSPDVGVFNPPSSVSPPPLQPSGVMLDVTGACIGCGYNNPDELIPSLMDRLDQFTEMFSRLDTYDNGAPIPAFIVAGAIIDVFWPFTEEITPAIVKSVDNVNNTVHVVWSFTKPYNLETRDLCVSWILPFKNTTNV